MVNIWHFPFFFILDVTGLVTLGHRVRVWIISRMCAWIFACHTTLLGIIGSGSSPLFRFHILLSTQTKETKQIWPMRDYWLPSQRWSVCHCATCLVSPLGVSGRLPDSWIPKKVEQQVERSKVTEVVLLKACNHWQRWRVKTVHLTWPCC